MTSLRWRLIVFLWLALALVGIGFAVFSYWQQRDEADELLDYQLEQIAGFLAARPLGASAAAAVAPQVAVEHDADDAFDVTIRSATGKLLYASQPQRPLPDVRWLGFRTIPIDDQSYRVYSGRSGRHRILIAQQIETRREVGRAAAWAAVQPLIAAIPLLALIIAAVIRRQLWPLRAAVADIAARPPLALSPLPPMRLPNEVQPLVDEINRLLARLREALDHERRFVADAAHALRTPLAALQLQADVLEGVADPVERQARLTELRAGIRRAARLTHHLLALARSDAASTARPVRSDVDEALRNLAESYRSLAAARNVTLSLDLHAGCNVGLDPYDLALAVGNLLDNALRYTAAGGTVLLRTRADDGQAGIDVVDEGPGLPDAELSKVFARFYRAPGDTTGGSGLGLATVKSIVEKAGGEVTLQNRTDRPGLSARLRLPNVGAAVPPLSATAP